MLQLVYTLSVLRLSRSVSQSYFSMSGSSHGRMHNGAAFQGTFFANALVFVLSSRILKRPVSIRSKAQSRLNPHSCCGCTHKEFEWSPGRDRGNATTSACSYLDCRHRRWQANGKGSRECGSHGTSAADHIVTFIATHTLS